MGHRTFLATLAALLLAAILTVFGGGSATVAASADAPVAILDAAKSMLSAPDRTLKRPSAPVDATGDDAGARAPQDDARASAPGMVQGVDGRGLVPNERTLPKKARAPPPPAG